MVINSGSNFYVKRNGQDRVAVTDTTSDFGAATNVRVQSNKAGSAYTWTFDDTGNLAAPGNVAATTYTGVNSNVILTTDISGTNSTVIFDAYNGMYFYWNGNVAGYTGFDGTNDYYLSPTGNTIIQSQLSVTGNISAVGDIVTTSNISAVNASYSGDVDANNILVAGVVSAGGTVTAAALTTSGSQGNISGANVVSAVTFTASGNINAANFFGDGGYLSNITANTGNVTFSDQIVIGTGISNLVSGLYLAPSSSSANAVQYLRVRGDVTYEPTHIHFDTGNNQYFNQFIGDDNKYVLLSNIGDIVIRTDDYAGNSAQWTFGTDGNLTVPGSINGLTNAYVSLNAFNNGDNPSIQLLNWDVANSAPSTLIAVDPNAFSIVANITGNTSYQWTFDNSGNLTLPANAIIKPASDDLTLDASAGNVYVKSKGHTFLFDANGVGRFVMPDQGKIAAYTQLSINVGDWANSAGSLWTFDNSGNLTLPANTFAVNYANGTPVTLGGGSAYANTVGSFGSDMGIGPNYALNDPAVLFSEDDMVIRTGGTAAAGSSNNGQMDIAASEVLNIGLAGNLVDATNITSYSSYIQFPYGGTTINAIAGSNYLTVDATAGLSYNGTPIGAAEAPFGLQASTFTATAGSRYGVDTNAAPVTATLPASPTAGDAIFFADAGGAYATNNFSVDPNGGSIMGVSDIMVVNTNNQNFGLFYNGTTWRTY
jgi:hypothetical protein